MQSLFTRIKRQANSVKTGDLEVFGKNGQAYIDFIEDLTELFTESNEKYGSIKVTNRNNGITKVNIKNGNIEIGFIYRNVNLYIIGFVADSVFYVDKEVTIQSDWTQVIGTSKFETLEALRYGNIMPDGGNAKLDIRNIDKSLEELLKVKNKNQRIDIMKKHFAPFVVAFSEAIRFPIVAKLVQHEIVKVRNPERGFLQLNTNIVPLRSLGSPAQRTADYIFSLHSLLLNWNNLSERVKMVFTNQHAECIEDTNYALNLCITQLSALLGVAHSKAFEKFVPVLGRTKRDLEQIYNNTVPQHPPLLEQPIINRIDHEGNVWQSPSSGIKYPTELPDMVGALHLLTVGMLYLYGRKINMMIGDSQNHHNPREAYGIAVDLVERVVCFIKSVGFEMEIDFEEEIQLQRELSRALIRGQSVEQVLTSFLEEKYLSKKNDVILGKVREQFSKELGNINGWFKHGEFEGNECFQ